MIHRLAVFEIYLLLVGIGHYKVSANAQKGTTFVETISVMEMSKRLFCTVLVMDKGKRTAPPIQFVREKRRI